MLSNKSIRIVKRQQREVPEEQPELQESGPPTDRQARRMMFETITSWIEERREIKKRLPRRLTLLEDQLD